MSPAYRVLVLGLLAFAGLTHPASGREAVTVRSADDVVESIGVNVHMSYTASPYSDEAAVARRLSGLGVRHVREGLVPGRADQCEALRALSRAGIGATLIVGDPDGRFGTLEQLLPILRGPVRGAAEAVEGANEYDLRNRGRRVARQAARAPDSAQPRSGRIRVAAAPGSIARPGRKLREARRDGPAVRRSRKFAPLPRRSSS